MNASCGAFPVYYETGRYKETLDAYSSLHTSTPDVQLNYSRKRSEPINFTRKRSNSEIQLYEDLLAAEYREYCMYLRVHGHSRPCVSCKSIARAERTSDLGLNVETLVHCNHESLPRNEESLSPASLQYLVNEAFAYDAMECRSTASITLPSIFMALESNPKVKELDYDVDGVFDMEL